jgi:hypothetical protein
MLLLKKNLTVLFDQVLESHVFDPNLCVELEERGLTLHFEKTTDSYPHLGGIKF